jgi:methylenetetrahydrofolate--tRNA-(uracil-5-)-methyltransferase
MAGRFVAARRRGEDPVLPPPESAVGALLGHLTGFAEASSFQPMNVNFGLFPPIGGRMRGRERKAALAARGRQLFAEWLAAAGT